MKTTAAPTGVTPAKSSWDIEKAMLELKEMESRLAAQQKDLDARAKELDAREVKMNTPSAEVVKQVVADHKTSAERMKENLHSQPKVTIMIPLDPGEAEGATIPVTLDGYKYTIMKNVYVEVPKQVADVVMNSLRQTNAAGAAFRTDVARPAKGGVTVEQALL